MSEGMTVLWVLCPVTLLLVALAVFLTFFIVRSRDERRLGEYQDKILRTQRDEVENIYRTMRGWRHDYHNHMQTIKAYLSMNRVEETLTYLDHLEEDLDSIDIAIRTGNVSVDAIVSSKISLADRKDIRVSCKAAVPKELKVSDVDLCVVIGNLLDNAIESCAKIPREKRFLRLYIGIFKKQLYISVSNATEERKRRRMSEFISSKYGNHGHGLRRIDAIAEKYDGYVNRKNEPGVFATEVMLPL